MSISYESLYRALNNNEVLEAKKLLEHPSLNLEDVDAFYFFNFVIRNGRHEILSIMLNSPRFNFILDDDTEDCLISFMLTAYSSGYMEVVDKIAFDDRFEKHLFYLNENKSNIEFYKRCMSVFNRKQRLKKVKSILE